MQKEKKKRIYCNKIWVIFSHCFFPSLLVRSECYPLINPFWHENANITDAHRQLLCE